VPATLVKFDLDMWAAASTVHASLGSIYGRMHMCDCECACSNLAKREKFLFFLTLYNPSQRRHRSSIIN
jgi:hypothetical protein